jgi:hypothetical protein
VQNAHKYKLCLNVKVLDLTQEAADLQFRGCSSNTSYRSVFADEYASVLNWHIARISVSPEIDPQSIAVY